MATRKATENVSEESTTATETATEPTASIEQRMAEIETLLNHLLNSREHIAHCGSDHFVNDWR